MPEVTLRRIKLHALDEKGRAIVVTIAPSAILPYMTGYTDAGGEGFVPAPFWCALLGLDLCFWSQ